uniref:Uncharacterized protein n=1 Tax=Setaria viridis TaxID=4556 RepID=A0A4U6TGA4_SETVI|nr:hypothetical protein SEVIR_8G123750v2 [Setaria viridis]
MERRGKGVHLTPYLGRLGGGTQGAAVAGIRAAAGARVAAAVSAEEAEGGGRRLGDGVGGVGKVAGLGLPFYRRRQGRRRRPRRRGRRWDGGRTRPGGVPEWICAWLAWGAVAEGAQGGDLRGEARRRVECGGAQRGTRGLAGRGAQRSAASMSGSGGTARATRGGRRDAARRDAARARAVLGAQERAAPGRDREEGRRVRGKRRRERKKNGGGRRRGRRKKNEGKGEREKGGRKKKKKGEKGGERFGT